MNKRKQHDKFDRILSENYFNHIENTIEAITEETFMLEPKKECIHRTRSSVINNDEKHEIIRNLHRNTLQHHSFDLVP